MGINESKYGLEHLLGNTKISRVLNPTIRGNVRRSNADGGHAAPYITGLTGKSLTVNVTPVGNLTINFSSDDMASAITLINAASSANLKASDDDGYLRLTNLNSGNKNTLSIVSGTAVPLFGFVIGEPGSISYAGELATSSSGRSANQAQNNPQGTVMIAADEDLTSDVMNREGFGLATRYERLMKELDIEVPVIRTVLATVNQLSGNKFFIITDPTIRFPILEPDSGGIPLPAAVLDSRVAIRSASTDYDVYDPTNSPGYLRVVNVYYSTQIIGLVDGTSTFSTWGTPDGKSVFGSSTKNKQGPVNITAIRGNIIEAPTAAFVTNVCQAGDTIVVEGSNNNVPFNHVGEFVITEVIDNTRIAVRAKASHETTWGNSNRPTELNSNLPGGTSYGTVRVIIGACIPASSLVFELPSWATNLQQLHVRILSYKRIRDLGPGDLGGAIGASPVSVGQALYTHVQNTTAHPAANITAAAVSGSPNNLGAGTVATQIAAILGFINSFIAGEVAYGGGPNWADALPNPATTVEAQLDKIIGDLGGSGTDGAARLHTTIQGVLPAGTLRAQLNYLRDNFLNLNLSNTLAGAVQTFNGQIVGLGSETVPFVQLPSPISTHKLLAFHLGNSSSTIRFYLNDSGGLEITYNAVWNGTGGGWTQDNFAVNSYRFNFAMPTGDHRIELQIAGAGSWADNSWGLQQEFLSTGKVRAIDFLHFTAYKHCHACSSFNRDTAATTPALAGAGWSFAGAGVIYSAMVYLKAGDVITTIKWTYGRASAGTILLRLERFGDFASGTLGGTIVQSDSDTTGTTTVDNTKTYNHTVLADSSYRLRFEADAAAGAAGSAFFCAMVSVTRP